MSEQTVLGGPHGTPGDDADRLARVVLGQVFEPGYERVVNLVREYGAACFLQMLLSQRTAGDITDQAGVRLRDLRPERDLEVAARLGIRVVGPGDPEWPAALDDLSRADPLQECGGPPFGLWLRGPLRLDQLTRTVAVVGSRDATTYGVDVASHLSTQLAIAGQAVVSGLAYGIDQAAHRGALAGNGVTVAVLANGLDRAYPPRHQALFDVITRECLAVSELAPGCSPSRSRFLARNRMIAALTQGTVVVEAAIRSGALNTANWAGRLHRHLMGVPGPVTQAQSQGVHHLVRMGAATLVTGGADVLEVLGASGADLLEEPRDAPRERDRLPPRLQRLLEAVPVARGALTDSVARTAGVPLFHARSGLDRLKRLGFVEETPQGWRMVHVDGVPVIPS